MSRRRRGRALRWGLGLLLLMLALTVLPVAVLRWLPAPTSAFMLQSPVRPVQHDWVAAAQIPEVARRAVVAAEDQKFFEHRGFDVEAMQKAYASNQKKGRRLRGASTISQQTAKNLFLWSGGGYFRKGLEAGYTVLIEAFWPKERILTVYLNIAEFGPGIYGVEAASQAYFKKPAARLSASEAARLAAVLPSPRKWSVSRPGPYVQKRSAWILRQMGAAGAPRPSARPVPERDLEPLPGAEESDDPVEPAQEAAEPAAEPAKLPPATVDAQAAAALQRALEQEPAPAEPAAAEPAQAENDPAQWLP